MSASGTGCSFSIALFSYPVPCKDRLLNPKVSSLLDILSSSIEKADAEVKKVLTPEAKKRQGTYKKYVGVLVHISRDTIHHCNQE